MLLPLAVCPGPPPGSHAALLLPCWPPRRRADPGAERVIGERAPFETDTRHAAAWATHALQLGGQRLDDALRDEQAFLEHWASMGQAPELK